MTYEPLAHSPQRDPPVAAQPYREHVESVRDRAVQNARKAAQYYAGDREKFVAMVDAAALYHDLGKLDAKNQAVLRLPSREALPVSHEDAGVEHLLRLRRNESAILVAAHHAGLFCQESERAKGGRAFRNLESCDHVDRSLNDYVAAHAHSGVGALAESPQGERLGSCGVTRRLALSCLVDADYSDTARHYLQEEKRDTCNDRRWRERLDRLQEYLAALPAGLDERQKRRNELRKRLFAACLSAPLAPAMRCCGAPTGTGKTTAVMAHVLRAAAESSPPLRHVFIVLPYTNIIQQTVEVYRRALVLPGENPEDIVAEHHHQADFGSAWGRHLATLWRAPIIVTTAVQFFETLASHRPARLRKLHELAGSAVVVDEAHAAIPAHLWPQVWKWLVSWTDTWGGRLVLASGSLPRCWELREFVNPPKAREDVPDLVPDDLRQEIEDAESQRVEVRSVPHAMNRNELVAYVQQQPGPRLLILNTVQSAAVVANEMRHAGLDVLHLSTALAPVHRDVVVRRIRERLRYRENVPDWTLVATSCVEAGLDFSFHTALRESCSVASVIQVGGRVNRENENAGAKVWDFRVNDPRLPANPQFQVAQNVLHALLEVKAFTEASPAALTTEAMRRECTEGGRRKAEEILESECGMNYPRVSKLCRVIEADTRLVIVDPEMADQFRRHKNMDRTTLLRYSVQMWTHKVRALSLTPLWPNNDDDAGPYVWTAAYDPDFLGYMAGVLPLLEGQWEGIFVV